MKFWERKTIVAVTARNTMEYFERAQRLAVSRPAWTDEDGNERRGKTVVLDIRALKESPGSSETHAGYCCNVGLKSPKLSTQKGGIFIDAKKQRALAALLSSPTKEAAARKAGINVKTLQRYLKDEDFSTAYKKQRRIWSTARQSSCSKVFQVRSHGCK